MQTYIPWKTSYAVWKSLDKSRRGTTIDEFTDMFQANMDRMLNDPSTPAVRRNILKMSNFVVATERAWASQDAPYYKVHPQMFSRLARTNLEAVPLRMIEMPHHLDVVCLMFPTEDCEMLSFKTDDDRDARISSLLCVKHLSNNQTRLGILVCTSDDRDNQSTVGPNDHLAGYAVGCSDVYIATLDLDKSIGETLREGPSKFTQFNPETGEAVEMVLGPYMLSYMAAKRSAIATLIAIGFLSNCSPELLDYDVLSEDRVRYHSANDDERVNMEARAKRKGKVGWNVGTDEMFVAQPWDAQPATHSGTGRELQWAHIRCGHPHAVRYGPGRQQVKIKWFRSAHVRPDLPFKKL